MSEVSAVFVVAMGLGTVFLGLICIILLSVLTSKVCQILEKMNGTAAPASVPAAVPAVAETPAPDRQAMIAAIAAAIAEDLGTDAAGIRILSVKKI